MRVCVVLVTYNRSKLLLECLSGLERQDWEIEKIFLVDNCSNDDTPSMIQRFISASPMSQRVEYIRMSENLGGAGGFSYGVARAMEYGADWVWLMDDDVEPTPNCLRALLQYRNLSGMIHPTKIELDGTEFLWKPYFDYHTLQVTNQTKMLNEHDQTWYPVTTANFEGALISRKVIEKIGLPNPEYFIGYDDTIYGFKASHVTNVIVVKDARFQRKLPVARRQTNIQIYHHLRNRYILKKEVSELGYKRTVIDGLGFMMFNLSALLGALCKWRSYSRLRFVTLALWDGYNGRFGRAYWKHVRG